MTSPLITIRIIDTLAGFAHCVRSSVIVFVPFPAACLSDRAENDEPREPGKLAKDPVGRFICRSCRYAEYLGELSL
jgi:hypothetical protein